MTLKLGDAQIKIKGLLNHHIEAIKNLEQNIDDSIFQAITHLSKVKSKIIFFAMTNMENITKITKIENIFM